MDPLPQLTPGVVFARDFRVVRPLSAGGMGAVYVVEQISTQRPRALKIMLPGLVQDAKSRERFTQEATVSARIRSDHVVEVVAAGIDEATGTPWLAMELLEGQGLDAMLAAAGRLPPADVLEIFRQLCHGLGSAHQNGLVHRDLKPENIFMTVARREGVRFMVKILDFGIAKLVGDSRTSAMATSAIGSPLWMSPEQADQGQIRPATDVWALGLIAFNLLTGFFYWRTANGPNITLPSLMREIYIDALEPASMRAAAFHGAGYLPPGFDPWFARCVVRDPTQRFRDATEALNALVPVLSGQATAPGYAVPGSTLAMASAPPMFTAPGAPPPQGGGFSPVTPYGASGPYSQPQMQPGMYPGGQPAMAPGTQAWQSPVGHPLPRAPSRTWLLLLIPVALVGLVAVVGVVVAVKLGANSTGATGGTGGTGPAIPLLGGPRYHGPVCVARTIHTDIAGLAGVAQVSAGRYHTCARLTDGTVRCWGWNAMRQLGDGTRDDRYAPTLVTGLTGVAQIVAGENRTCALRGDGTVWCWGLSQRGIVGLPTQVGDAGVTTQIDVGGQHVCGRHTDGTVWCWGNNNDGQLGDGTTESRVQPVMVRNLAGVAQVVAGGYHTCALQVNGTVWCWGRSEQGQLGDGQRSREARPVPVPVPGLGNVAQLSAGEQHTCARLRDGTVRCWGANDMGQLGTGTTDAQASPVPVQGLAGVADLAVGYQHSCARKTDGTPWCWGQNFVCQIGPLPMSGPTTPVQVPVLDRVIEVVGGGMHTCAVRTNGTVRCWGMNNFGQLGNGTSSNRPEYETQ